MALKVQPCIHQRLTDGRSGTWLAHWLLIPFSSLVGLNGGRTDGPERNGLAGGVGGGGGRGLG